ncbi:MAG: RNA ligase [Gemmataceae bacterium]
MELRVDRLLCKLRDNAAPILDAIDRDALLLKRASGSLVLANASQALYTPQQEHQLFAKGIVYRRDPYRVVSLPLIKIYNLGERDVTVADLAALSNEPDVRLRFLRKIDGSLIQVFRHDGRVWFTTRGTIEGARPRSRCDNGEDSSDFDYLGTARRLAAERYPRLLDAAGWSEGRTLLFELIHPLAKKVTNYGDSTDLILLGCFDTHRMRYATYPQVTDIAKAYGLSVVEALSPTGAALAEQIENLLAALAGTDQEGYVLQFENAHEVVYRVKVKSPDYLRLTRAMTECTYESLVALMDDNPHLTSWQDAAALLGARGRDVMPEEALPYYRPHYERFAAYLADCERLRQWATQVHEELDRQLGGRHGKDAASYRKSYAALATRYRHAALLFAVLDGRLDRDRLRRLIRDPEQARRTLSDLGLT